MVTADLSEVARDQEEVTGDRRHLSRDLRLVVRGRRVYAVESRLVSARRRTSLGCRSLAFPLWRGARAAQGQAAARRPRCFTGLRPVRSLDLRCAPRPGATP